MTCKQSFLPAQWWPSVGNRGKGMRMRMRMGRVSSGIMLRRRNLRVEWKAEVKAAVGGEQEASVHSEKSM